MNTHSLTSTTSFLTATTLIYAIGAGITRLLAPDLPSNGLSIRVVRCSQSNCKTNSPALWFIVTTSLCQDWVIYAPAAFLGCGSHLSGSLSEIEPKFFVTRYCHGRPICYHRKLIGQKLERLIATLSMRYDRLLLLTIMPKHMVFILINTSQRDFTHVLALELLRLSN